MTKPKTLFLAQIPYLDGQEGRKRIISFLPATGHEVFLSYSIGREHGPGIIRDGLGSPKMQEVDRPWQYTSDPNRQRAGTWRVFTDSSSEMSHVGEFQRTHPGHRVLSVQGFGDLTMNLWNTAYVNNAFTGEPRLLHLRDEPIDSRIYSCFIKWKDAEGRPSQYSIEQTRFNAFEFDRSRDSPSVVLIDSKPVADRIEFAVFGQQVIQDSKVVNARQLVHQFADVRHLLTLPNLNPGPVRSRFFYGAERTDDVWFGEAQLLDDRNLRRAALTGSVELNRLYKGLGCSKNYLEEVLNSYGTYVGDETHRTLKEGEWRWIPEDENLVEIYLRRNTYPCTMLGVTRGGNILSLAWTGKYDTPGGWTIEDAAGELLKYGATEAILCDEGADVMQRGVDMDAELEIANKREHIRAVLIFAEKDQPTVLRAPEEPSGA
jgi:hypothetical protein